METNTVSLIIALVVLALVIWGMSKVAFPVTSHFEMMLVIEEQQAFKTYRSPQKVAKEYGLDEVELIKLLTEMTNAGRFECFQKRVGSLGSVTFYRYKKP
jgi:hypothetical protein